VNEIVWRPDEATLRHANATRLVERAGAASYAELVRRSIEDPEWFWPLVVEDLGLEFARPWTQVLDASRGPAWATWFVDGQVSIAHNCAHRWAAATPQGLAATGTDLRRALARRHALGGAVGLTRRARR
jgi:acetyl-CoA synthetase